jgi:hypothetical protein
MVLTGLETEAYARRQPLPFTVFRTRQASLRLSTRPGCPRVGVFLAVLGSRRSRPVLANSMASIQHISSKMKTPILGDSMASIRPISSKMKPPAPASSTASSSLTSRKHSSSTKIRASFIMQNTAPTSPDKAARRIRIQDLGPSKPIRVSPPPLHWPLSEPGFPFCKPCRTLR